MGKGRSTDSRGERRNEAMRMNVGRKRAAPSRYGRKTELRFVPAGTDSAVASIRARPIRQFQSPTNFRGKSTASFRRCR